MTALTSERYEERRKKTGLLKMGWCKRGREKERNVRVADQNLKNQGKGEPRSAALEAAPITK